MILIATSFPVGTCFANFTLAKLPLPIVFNSLYLPMCSSPGRHLNDTPGRYCVFGEPCEILTENEYNVSTQWYTKDYFTEKLEV